jgi:cold shock CspA family protein
MSFNFCFGVELGSVEEFRWEDDVFVTKNGIQAATDPDLKEGGVLGYDFSSRMLKRSYPGGET